MSWLCDVCGYENEYNEEIKVTVCNCCGEAASESKLIQAQKELDDFHKEEEQRIRLEEIAKRTEHIEALSSNFILRIKKVGRAIPIVMLVSILISVGWIAVSFVFGETGLSFVEDMSDGLDYAGDNLEYVGQKVEDFTWNVDSNRPIREDIDDVAQSAVENIPVTDREVINAGSNMVSNFPIYTEYLTENVREVYELITRKGE